MINNFKRKQRIETATARSFFGSNIRKTHERRRPKSRICTRTRTVSVTGLPPVPYTHDTGRLQKLIIRRVHANGERFSAPRRESCRVAYCLHRHAVEYARYTRVSISRQICTPFFLPPPRIRTIYKYNSNVHLAPRDNDSNGSDSFSRRLEHVEKKREGARHCFTRFCVPAKTTVST